MLASTWRPSGHLPCTFFVWGVVPRPPPPLPPPKPLPHRCIRREGPQRRPQKRLDRPLGEVAQAVGGGYCRLQKPLTLALAIKWPKARHVPKRSSLRGMKMPELLDKPHNTTELCVGLRMGMGVPKACAAQFGKLAVTKFVNHQHSPVWCTLRRAGRWFGNQTVDERLDCCACHSCALVAAAGL